MRFGVPDPAAPLRASAGSLAAAVGLLLAAAGPVVAQEPPDTAQVPDSAAVADTGMVADSAQLADSAAADTVFYNLPLVRDRIPSGFHTGVWSWGRHAIMASGANTLAELFEHVPGLVPLYGGDYGAPLSMSAFGRGTGAYRIIRDGFELYPLAGSVPDLQQIGLVGIQRVRLRRAGGRMLVEMWSHRHDDGRPFSVVEAGTGDLDTNMFRGVYADPTALWGSIAVGLERVDTRGIGPSRSEGGNRTGAWARYQYHFGDRAGIALDYRSGGSQTQVDRYAPSMSRKDLVLQASVRLLDGVVVQALSGRSTLERTPTQEEEHSRIGGSRRQHMARIGLERGPFWLDGSFRLFEGGLPTRRFAVEGGGTSPRWGGFTGRFATGSWRGERATNMGARIWLTPLPWTSLFAEYETGDFGARAGPVQDEPPPVPLVDDGGVPGVPVVVGREALRAGATVSPWGFTLGAAALYAYSDEASPLGLELDAGAPSAPGVHTNGYEATVVLPMPLDGLTLEGSYQRWDDEGPYLPKQIYRGSFEFHRVFLESGNLEVWGSLGVRGHDPMLTFAPATTEEEADIVRVPFFQSWYAHMQVRVVTVRLWLGMENMTFRRNLQTYPDRRLPYARSFFALRWDMWN